MDGEDVHGTQESEGIRPPQSCQWNWIALPYRDEQQVSAQASGELVSLLPPSAPPGSGLPYQSIAGKVS